MASKKLSDRAIKALKSKGRRYDVRDAQTPGLVVRVSPAGARTFTLQARFPGSGGKATRRTLGTYPETTLEEAREKAREWRKQVKLGIDPAVAEKRTREVAEHAAGSTFDRVAE